MKAEPGEKSKTAVIVLGMHRSGTSAMARVMALSGGHLPTSVMPPGPGNPTGHWEPQEVADFNDRIFADLDSGWDDTFGPRNIRQRKLATQKYMNEASEIIERNYGESNLIVLKEPRTAILLDVWRDALEQKGFKLHYIIMIRHPSEVAHSLNVRNGFPVDKSLLLWANYMLSCEIGTRHESRVFVRFDDLLAEPEAVLDRIEAEFGLLLPRRTWDSALEIQTFLNRDHKHHNVTASSKDLQYFGEIERLYRYLDAASQGEPWNVDVSTETADWLTKLDHTVNPLLKALERNLKLARSEAATARDKAAAAQAELESKAIALQTQTATTEVASQRLAQVEGALSETQARMADRETELTNSLAEAAARANEFQRRAAEIEATLAAAQTQSANHVAELSSSLTEATLQVNLYRTRAAELETALAQSAAQSAGRDVELNARLGNVQQHAKDIEANLALTQTQLTSQQAAWSEAVDQLAVARQHATQTKAALAQMEARLIGQRADFSARLAKADARAHQADARALQAERCAADVEADHAAQQAKFDQQLARQAEGAQKLITDKDNEIQAIQAAWSEKERELSVQKHQVDGELGLQKTQSAALARALSESVASRNRSDQILVGALPRGVIRRLFKRLRLG